MVDLYFSSAKDQENKAIIKSNKLIQETKKISLFS